MTAPSGNEPFTLMLCCIELTWLLGAGHDYHGV